MRKFISGLVLGAGASQRFGQPKQLLPFRGTTMLGWVVDQAQQATSLDEVVENPVFSEGCSSSYRAGIGALDAESAAIMIILGDLPGITPEIINRLAEAWREHDAPIALCSYEGRKGHPMIFARSMFAQLVDLHGDKAAWKLVDANAARVQEVSFASAYPDDINTPEDFERLATAGKEN
jgi:molybdenum cofactor cytidylyltransferase